MCTSGSCPTCGSPFRRWASRLLAGAGLAHRGAGRGAARDRGQERVAVLAALIWTHPVHGEVTEVSSQAHELPARQTLRELGIKYTARPVAEDRAITARVGDPGRAIGVPAARPPPVKPQP